jgi:hypothetical protein
MEKQQEILFSVVSGKSQNDAHRQSYPSRNMPVNVPNYHIDPFMRQSSEQKVEKHISSAFKPSKAIGVNSHLTRVQVSPTAHQSQNMPGAFSSGMSGNNALSQVQLLSELCSSILGKQM